MKVFAPAKVNLALHVTGRRADGYHLLDSLVVFVGIGDWITVEQSEAVSLTVSGPRAEGVPTDERNLMWQAAAVLGRPVALTLEKHLPNAGGIGGGSADCAATMRALTAIYDLPRPKPETVLTLGSDVPVCYAGRPARMSGIGEALSSIPPLPPLWCVLVNAGVPVSTGPVFNALTSVENAPLPDPVWSERDSFFAWLAQTRNDLETPALTLVPEIGEVLSALQATPACRLSRMSGSGGTCFGLFDTADSAASAMESLKSSHQTWWVATAPVLTEPPQTG